MSGDGTTLDFYEREAWAYCASGAEGVSRHLDSFLARLPAGARVLELGCGGGRDAARMIERGFDVIPMDGSAAMAAIATARIGRPVRVLRFDLLDDEDAFEAVWAHASLLHVPRVQLPDVLARVYRALRPGGWHFASFKSGETEGRDRFGRRFNFPDNNLLAASYRKAGAWGLLDIDGYAGSGYDDVPRRWLAVTAHKPGQATDEENTSR